MEGKRTISAAVAAVVLSLLLVSTAGVGTTSAQSQPVTVEFDTSYDGVEGDGSQAVDVTGTFTVNSQVSGLEVRFSESGPVRALVEFDSFNITSSQGAVQPVQGQEGAFRAESLSSGQTFTISFETYPKRLDQQSLRVATYRMSAENPQTFEVDGFVTAELSNSPYLRYQDETEGDFLTQVGLVGAILVAIVGVGAALFVRFRTLPNRIEAKEDEFVERLNDVLDEYDRTDFQRPIQDLIDKIRGDDLY